MPASNPKRLTPDSWGARLEVEAGDLALEQLQVKYESEGTAWRFDSE